ncbi:MAG: sel1 repeat family protein [Deltaproteobacteria bacterium]|jgi:TPR repeat protein|nr:sel1 repeat family protein [Deltaproteobacteria bacterium]
MDENEFARRAGEFLKKEADEGNAAAASLLVEAMFFGLLEEADSRALPWLTKAANYGESPAQTLLGDLYLNGRAVAQDSKEAARLYRQAAESGLAAAQSRLAGLHKDGLGVAQDFGQAAHWYLMAAEQGDLEAHRALAQLYLEGLGVPQDLEKAAYCYLKAAEMGCGDSQAAIGVFYSLGQGVPQNMIAAVEWWEKAANQGHEGADSYLKSLAEANLIVERLPASPPKGRPRATPKPKAEKPARAAKTPKEPKDVPPNAPKPRAKRKKPDESVLH